jgi:beta-glucosidase
MKIGLSRIDFLHGFTRRPALHLAIFSMLTFACALPFQLSLAADLTKHPSITGQVRLASWWMARHAEKIAEIEAANDPKKDKKIELLMVGDSITNNFDEGGPGEPVWEKHFAQLDALNLGFGGDRTNHVMWRLEHLPALKTPPKAASLMIGTNNICWGSDKPKQAADGVQAISRKLNSMYPEMKILVLGVFPRRRNLDHPHRKQIIELNSYLPNLLKDIPNVTFLDIGEKFLDEKGFLSQEMMPDTTHPSEKGHEIWAAAIIPKLKEMMAQ